MSRVTINEIARRSGVSKGAVSYALNGRPGVSAATRERILAVADQLGWAPNRTARLLSGSRTDTFGLILARDPRTLAREPFYMELVAGLEEVLSTRSYALLLQVCTDTASEMATYRKWSSERRVDAVVVVDIVDDDPRLPLLRELGLPAVLTGHPSIGDRYTTVWTDDAAAMDSAVGYLAGLGHRRIARVSGFGDLLHVRIRNRAFLDAAAAHGTAAHIVRADFSAEGGRAATREIVASAERPTAIVFDNDLMAVAALSALAELGVTVPGEMSVLAWDDSALCEVTHPRLAAMSRDVVAFGALIADQLFAVIDGGPPVSVQDVTATLTVRASTAPPRAVDAQPVGSSPS